MMYTYAAIDYLFLDPRIKSEDDECGIDCDMYIFYVQFSLKFVIFGLDPKTQNGYGLTKMKAYLII